MKHDGKFFILDAKYYKFGITGLAAHLPATSSIQKQITYGDYVAVKGFADENDIYNAFVMPYAAKDGEDVLKFVSVGTADWIDYSDETANYKYVLGILLDTRHIMTDATTLTYGEITQRRDALQRELANLYQSEPLTSKRSYQKAQNALKNEEEQFFTKEELNKMLPQHLRD